MEKTITTTLNVEELQELIIDAVKKATGGGSPEPEVTDDKFLNQREAAEFLHISLPTIIRWKKYGKIPYYQEGRKPLFKKSELLKVLHKNRSLLK